MKPLVEKMNPLQQLHDYGQSVWLDYIRRSLILSGELKHLIKQDGLKGMTSNPSIFEKAIAGSSDYTQDIESARKNSKVDAYTVYEQLAVHDIQLAADALRPVWQESQGKDGYVSLEVSPLLASDTEKTIAEARRLWKTVNRENLMVKVPATPEGLPAIKQLLSDGININITLLFSQKVYEQVVEAYISGLEELDKNGGDVSKTASVASFFVSRIDTAVDTTLEKKLAAAKNDQERKLYQSLLGKVAIANAKLAYQHYLKIFSSKRWLALKGKGAHVQRLLWASTSTKNPNYRDVIYVEELIGADTVNTIPPATFEAFRDHGLLRNSLTENIDDAAKTMDLLNSAGISIDQITNDLLKQGVVLFADAFKQLLNTLEKQLAVGQRRAMDRLSYKLPVKLATELKSVVQEWHSQDKIHKLWSGAPNIWTKQDENNWLGWLHIIETQLSQLEQFIKLSNEIKNAGFKHALLLGMGGSSLCAEVLSKTFGTIAGSPELVILDSTDPQQIKTVEQKIDLTKTIFIVSSKSGTTLEPNIYKEYFWQKVIQVVGTDKAGQHFIAITDPGSKLQEIAQKDKFRQIYFGLPSIGGRYSALSNFGMVPAAVMGLDVKKFLDIADEMLHACSYCVAPEENPGFILGAIMGILAKAGHDKVTFITSPAIYDLGAWLEQLLAESTGKQGHGLIPVDREEVGPPDIYGNDRLFVYLKYDAAPDTKQEVAVDHLEKAGQPIVRISLPDLYHVSQEFFRWEFATAVAGAIIGINPFDQPDVEASKVATRKLTAEYESSGKLPAEQPFYEAEGIKLFSDKANIESLNKIIGSQEKTLASYLRAHFNRLSTNDYLAMLAFIEMNQPNEKVLQEIRHAVRDKKEVATCLGFGPRFLHSTGQAYKGGPNSGVYLQITCDDAHDLPVPGQKYTFGIVKAAQARGDFEVLSQRQRRVLRVHLKDMQTTLTKFKTAVITALS